MSSADRNARKARLDNLPVVEMDCFLPPAYLKAKEEALGRIKSNISLYSKIIVRVDPENLMDALIDTVARFESLVLFELKILESEAINCCFDLTAQKNKMMDLKKGMEGLIPLERQGINVINQKIEAAIKLSIASNPIVISSEEETRLMMLFDLFPATTLAEISEWPIKRKNARPSKKYRNKLVIEVYDLLREHASSAYQQNVGRNIQLTAEIIPTISPIINITGAFKVKDVGDHPSDAISNHVASLYFRCSTQMYVESPA